MSQFAHWEIGTDFYSIAKWVNGTDLFPTAQWDIGKDNFPNSVLGYPGRLFTQFAIQEETPVRGLSHCDPHRYASQIALLSHPLVEPVAEHEKAPAADAGA